MTTRQIIIATIVGAVVLFLFDGAFQALPDFGVRAVERLETNELTSKKFNELTDRMVYIVSDQTVSFVTIKQADYYNLTRFFKVEFLSAFSIALIFAVVFGQFKFTNLRERILLTFAFSLIASLAIHFPYFNWWGFSFSYTLGVVSKTILGWILLSYIQNRFIYKIR